MITYDQITIFAICAMYCVLRYIYVIITYTVPGIHQILIISILHVNIDEEWRNNSTIEFMVEHLL